MPRFEDCLYVLDADHNPLHLTGDDRREVWNKWMDDQRNTLIALDEIVEYTIETRFRGYGQDTDKLGLFVTTISWAYDDLGSGWAVGPVFSHTYVEALNGHDAACSRVRSWLSLEEQQELRSMRTVWIRPILNP